jgi:hypothetical protein
MKGERDEGRERESREERDEERGMKEREMKGERDEGREMKEKERERRKDREVERQKATYHLPREVPSFAPAKTRCI